MIQKNEVLLDDYARKYDIHELSREDIIKLMTKPYITREITNAFGISEKEFNKIRKQMGLNNLQLENIKRDIKTILHYVDSKNRYISQNVRKKLINILISIMVPDNLPRRNFYIKKLLETDFNRQIVYNDFQFKEIDFDYRIEKFSSVIDHIEMIIDTLIEKEKNYFFSDNNEKIYNQLMAEKNEGKIFVKKDLSYDILFELAIVENIPDSMIADFYNISINEVRSIRKKFGFANKYKTKIEKFPEIIGYLSEKNKRMPEDFSNYEYEKMMNNIIKKKETTFVDDKIIQENNDDIVVYIDNKQIPYHVCYLEEKYAVKSTGKKRKYNGTRHNYQKENETKRLHGKIGEQLALEAEKRRLINQGLGDLVDEVKLITQIDEETTFDGLGYDLISFNENRERIFIEVKTSFSAKDKPFYISQKELDLIQGLKEEYRCKNCLIYYILIDGSFVFIKRIYPLDFDNLKLTPVLYKVG